MCCGWYGIGIGVIWLDSLQCIGNEIFLLECLYLGWGNYYSVCIYVNDVGVYCIFNFVIFLGQFYLIINNSKVIFFIFFIDIICDRVKSLCFYNGWVKFFEG